MVRSLTFVPAMLCAAAIVSAQAPAKPDNYPPATQPAPQQPTTQAPAAQAPAQPAIDDSRLSANKVTYIGCLKPGTAAGTWLLDNAEVARPGASGQASASSPGGAGTVGTSGTAKASFNLNAKPGTDLKPHANHKVEVVGIAAPAKLSMPSGQPGAGAQPERQEFAVDSVKMVSTTCP